MATYSYSQISTYLTCPMKYKFEKIDNIKPVWEENLPMMLGSCVHDSLEYLYKSASKLQVPTQDQLINHFQKERTQAMKAMKSNHDTLFGQSKITDNEAEPFRNRWEHYLSEFYTSKYPFNQYKLLDTEKVITFKLDENIYFTGKIDRVDLNGPSIIINDYKTNTKILPDESDKVKEQINLYGLGMKELYASKINTVKWVAHYLHFNQSYEREIDNQICEQIREKYLTIAHEIETKKKQFALGDKDAFPCSVGSQCDYCPFKQICPARKHEYMEDETILNAQWNNSQFLSDHQSLHQLIDKYKETKDQIKTLEEMLDMYKEMLVTYATSRNLKRLFSPHNTLQIMSRSTASFTLDDHIQIEDKLKQLGVYDQLLSVNTHKLMALLKSWEKTIKDFDGLVQVKVTNYISKATNKNKEND